MKHTGVCVQAVCIGVYVNRCGETECVGVGLSVCL